MLNPLRPNHQRARTLLISFSAIIGMALIACISDFMQINLLEDFKNGSPNVTSAKDNDLRQVIIRIVSLCVLIINIVFFIMWFRRAYYNIQLAGLSTDYTEGWAAGCWFVPIMNWVRPYQIMKEIWNKTQDATPAIIDHKTGSFIGVWWAVYLASYFASTIVTRMMGSFESIDGLISETWADIGTNLLDIVSATISVVLVLKTSALEDRLYTAVEQQDEMQGDMIGYIA